MQRGLTVRFLAFWLPLSLSFIPKGFAGPELKDFQRVARESVYDGHFHPVPFFHPISFGFDGTINIGVGLNAVPMTAKASPTITLAGDFTKKTIRLPTDERALFQVPDNGMPYVVIKNARLEAAFGVSLAAVMPGGWSVYASVAPRIGGSLQIEKYVSSPAEEVSLQLPYAMHDLANWTIGDSVSYSTKIGISAQVGVAYTSLIRAGFYSSTDGEMMLNVRKIGPTSLRVTLYRSSSQNAGAMFTIPLTMLQSGAIRQQVRNYSYTFNLAQPNVEKSFQELMWGRKAAADELADIPGSGVEDVSFSITKAHGHGYTGSAGFPVVHMNEVNRKRIDVDAFMLEQGDEPAVEAHLAFLSKTTSTNGLLSHHYLKHRGFYGVHLPRHDQEPAAELAGSFKWFYEEDDATLAALHSELEVLRHRMGLQGLADGLQVVDAHRKGYTRFELSLPITEQTIAAWLNSSHDLPYEQHVGALKAGMRAYFEHHPLQHQHWHIAYLSAARRMYHARSELAKLMQDLKALSELPLEDPARAGLLAHFGYHLTKDRFTLAYFAHLSRANPEATPLVATLRILGEHLEPYKQQITIGEL